MPTQRPISRKTLIGIGRELRAEYGSSLTRDLFSRRTGLPTELIDLRFGNWDRFRRRLGITSTSRTKQRRVSDAELIDQLRRWGGENPNITLVQFCKRAGVCYRTIYDRFTSWRDLREAAGLPRYVMRRPVYSEDEILSDLLRIYFKAGCCPGYHDLKRWGGKFSATTYLARYGSWQGVKIRLEIYRREYMARTDPTWSWEKEHAERCRLKRTTR